MLCGELGAGKTAFARGFIQALQDKKTEITSPTFTLAQHYPTREGWPVWHFDLYRLRQEAELEALGLEEAIETGVALIEWPELAESRLPPQALTVSIVQNGGHDQRMVTLSGDPQQWASRLGAVA